MQGKKIDDVLEGLNQKFQALKVLEGQLGQRRMRLLTKLPEIQKAHDIVKKMIAADGAEVTLDFELSPHVYSKAKLNDVKHVNLWLGAGVMMEYELSEAMDLLVANLAGCKANIATTESDIGFIKESITTTEVSIARVYNYDVEARRKLKEEEATS